MWNFEEWWANYTKWYGEYAEAQGGCVGPAMSREWARANVHSPEYCVTAQQRWENDDNVCISPQQPVMPQPAPYNPAPVGVPPPRDPQPAFPGPAAVQYPNPSTRAALEKARQQPTLREQPMHSGPALVPPVLNEPGYESLADVLSRAFNQAAQGKGAERHATDLPFSEQPMQQIAARRGIGFILGQADKKSEEAQGMVSRGETDKAVHELLGAIVYLAGAVIYLEK